MSNRRDFMKATAAVGGAATVHGLASAFAAGAGDTIKVGLIGCGGRGMGAIKDILNAEEKINGAAPKIEIVAVADAFKGQATNAVKTFTNEKSKDYGRFVKQVKITPDTTFDGLDAYEKLLKTDANLVILATPPGFRPYHLEAAVKAGKHIFCEKPVAVDATGARKCYSLVEESKKKNIAIVAGTQRRHQKGYIETVKKIQDGALGELRAARCSWNGRRPWFKDRPAEMADSTYQLHNWYHYLWACGDHIVEQHVHNLDVINWALQGHPEQCMGMGGRAVRTLGNIYDHFAVEYEYGKGVRVASYCRQINGSTDRIAERVVGTKGAADIDRGVITGEKAWKYEGPDPDHYVQEMADLIQSIRENKPINEAKNVAESTMNAVMGRMSAYTGRALKWDWAMNASKQDLTPPKYDWIDLPVEPVATPGKTQLV